MTDIKTSGSMALKPRVMPRTLPPLDGEEKYMHRKVKLLNDELENKLQQLLNDDGKVKGKFKTPHKLVPLNEQDSSRKRSLKHSQSVRFNSLPAGNLTLKKRLSQKLSTETLDIDPLSQSSPGRLLSLRGSLEMISSARRTPSAREARKNRRSPVRPGLTLTRSRDSFTRRGGSPNRRAISPRLGASPPRLELSRSRLGLSPSRSNLSRRRHSIRSDAAGTEVDTGRLEAQVSFEDDPDGIWVYHKGGRRRLESTKWYKKGKGRMGAKFRRLAKFLSVLFSLWRTHAARVKNFLDTNVDLMEYNEPVDLMFDVTEFKADKQGSVSQETKRILLKKPADRTEEEVKYVQVALRNYQTMAEYPIQMTKTMAQKAWLERYDRKRIIVQQGHPARCYYFILSGSVIVSRMDSEYSVSRTVCFLNRGEQFGELGLLSNSPRKATVISKEAVELLVFSDEDYIDIFMAGGFKGACDPFVTNLWCFENWPTEIIEDHKTEAFLSYFKRNTVLVPDSHESEWIYIVKSGSCTILKKLQEVPPTSRQSQRADKENESPQEKHTKKMQQTESVLKAKTHLRSTIVRRKELYDLKLGIPTRPIADKPGLMDAIGFISAFNVPKVNSKPALEEKREDAHSVTFASSSIDSINTNASKEGDSQVEENQDTGDETGSKLATIFKSKNVQDTLSSKGPFLAKTPAVDDSSASQEEVKEPVQNDKVSGDLKSDSRLFDVLPRITEDAPETAEDVVKESTDKQTSIAQSLATLNKKPTEFRMEKKTIMDEINKKPTPRSSKPEDKEPMFVRVQTLTKGEIFGLVDLVHYDQPSLSLISNGAECMLIKKKLYMQHASQALVNKIRSETSPYPTNVEMQASLQVYVDWVNQKEKTMRKMLSYNQRERHMSVHDSRSSLVVEKNPKTYRVQLAGPLHG